VQSLATAIAALATLLATSAFAADMPVKAPPPTPIPVMSWTGFYVGGNVGGVWENDPGNTNWFEANSPPTLTNTPQSNSVSSSSVIGGIQGGYNWQINRWVAGVEADWDWTRTKYTFCRTTYIFGLPCADNGSGFLTMSGDADWLASVRGRLGFLLGNNLLVYGTAGGALGKTDTSINANCLHAGCGFSITLLNTTANFSNTKGGWVAGGGLEWMLAPQWFLRAEYLHTDLGSVTNTLNLTGSVGLQSASWTRSLTYDEVRGGLSYKVW
jgi:outer membrane immunogenic protein